MNKTLKLWGIFSVFMILLAGCGSTAHIEKDDNTDLSQYRTFAWVDKDGEGTDDSDKKNDLTESRIRQAVNSELVKEGWKEVKNRPDILISYDVLVERTVQETNSPVYTRPYSRVIYNPYTRRYSTIYYPSEFAGYERDERDIREGTVTITMIDTKKDQTIWQGWTTEEVKSRNLTSKEIQYAVRSIFKKFDVAKN